MTNAVIVGYARSPMHFAHKGKLTRVRPDDLAGLTIKGLVERSKVDPEHIEDLIMGNAMPEGEQGLNLARNVVFTAGLPIGVGGVTVNRFCASSMTSVHIAAGYMALGAGEVFIAAGVESMTRVPMGGFNPSPNPSLVDAGHEAYIGMGETAENLAEKYQITREKQEAFAVESHKRAAAAAEKGHFTDEIVPIHNGEELVETDGTIRADTSAEGLAGLKPAFDANGTVTAGTSSPLTDGAAAVMMTSEAYAEKHGLEPLARVKSVGIAGVPPEIMGIGPVPAVQKALERADLKIDDIDIIELNEAFAAQALSVMQDGGFDHAKTNIDGGAISLGHALGASGARITGKAASLLKRENKKYALATMCVGGGQGGAVILEAM